MPPATAASFEQPVRLLAHFQALNTGILAARKLDGEPTAIPSGRRPAVGKPTYQQGPTADQAPIFFRGEPEGLEQVMPYISSFAVGALDTEQQTPEQITKSRINIASALAYLIASLHPYPDGNKATARVAASWAMQENLDAGLSSTLTNTQPADIRTETILAATRHILGINPDDATTHERMLANIANITDGISNTLGGQAIDDEGAYANNIQALSGAFYRIRNREIKQRLAILMASGHLGAAACHIVLGEHQSIEGASRRQAKRILNQARTLTMLSTIITVESILQDGQFDMMTDTSALSNWLPEQRRTTPGSTLQQVLAAIRAKTQR